MSSKQAVAKPEKREEVKSRWLSVLDQLLAELKTWALEDDWSVRVVQKQMRSEELGVYQASCLVMQKESVKIMVEPVSHQSPGTEGIVDLYLMPAYDDIATLYHKKGEWKLHYYFEDDQMNLNGPVDPMNEAKSRKLSKKNLHAVLNAMVNHASGQS